MSFSGQDIFCPLGVQPLYGRAPYNIVVYPCLCYHDFEQESKDQPVAKIFEQHFVGSTCQVLKFILADLEFVKIVYFSLVFA